LVLMTCIIVAAIGRQRALRADTLTEWGTNSALILRLTGANALNWLRDREGGSALLTATAARNPAVFGIATRGQPLVAPKKFTLALAATLKTLRATGQYSGIWVFDRNGQLVGSATGGFPAAAVVAAARSSLSVDSVFVAGPYAVGASNAIALARAVRFSPSSDTSQWLPTGTLMGSIVLTVDPEAALFRSLAGEDAASSGGRTSLLVRERDSVYEYSSAGRVRQGWSSASVPRLQRMAFTLSGASIPLPDGEYVQSVRTIPGVHWRLVRRASSRAVYAAADGRLLNELALVVMVGLGFGWLLLIRAKSTREQRLWEIEASETKYRLLAENATDIIARHGVDGRITYISPALQITLGYESGEFLGHFLADYAPLGEESPIGALVLDSFATIDVITVEHQIRHADGHHLWVETMARAVRDAESARIVEIVTVTRDITARKRADAAVRASEEHHRGLFTANPIPMWTFDQGTHALLAVNEASLALYGYTREEFLRLSASDLSATDESDLVKTMFDDMSRGGPRPHSRRHRAKDGRIIDVELFASTVNDAGHEIGLVGVKDVTDRTKLEAQLRHAQKMDAVGRLAGGIAHDFNNMLTVISSYACMLLNEGAGCPTFNEDMSEIKAAADRASTLTRQLLAFSRQQVLEPQVIDLNVLVSGVEQMLRRLLPEDISLRTSLSPTLGPVLADPGQLEQVLVNLVVNARDAMPDGGMITVETMNLDADHFSGLAGADAPRAMLAVTDAGCGMSKETQAQIFEPFFTTKEMGSGTGLGLSTAHGIVAQSGGTISVYSELGIGTTFKVCLPQVVDALSTASGGNESGYDEDAGVGTILLAEDEASVRTVTTRILESAGYTVIAASNGVEALARHGEYRERIDLVVTDMVMPEMGGQDLAIALRQSGSVAPVLFMSGYTEQSSRNRSFLDGGNHFIHKPFIPNELTRKVAAVLQLAATAGAV
jgi:PAS domain S-box-containing protein